MKEGEILPKSAQGVRTVPIPAILRAYLEQQWLRGGTRRLVFGDGNQPFAPKSIEMRSRKAWTEAKLTRITLHECRHTYASFAIAAGVNANAVST